MIPFAQAQRALQVKLSLDDIEREAQGADSDAAERLLWRRYYVDVTSNIMSVSFRTLKV